MSDGRHSRLLREHVVVPQVLGRRCATLPSDLTKVDVAQLTAELSTCEAQLRVSYAAIAKIQSLNLLDYLR